MNNTHTDADAFFKFGEMLNLSPSIIIEVYERNYNQNELLYVIQEMRISKMFSSN